ncbi:dynein light chain Tctex-type 5-like [Centroberyx affinis]|uniref:dynein light chain Tctex-type 5-like n=1 Tax=Centroberyx affinis TaxID=166261 RepID=UPI003A5C3EBF
MDKSKETKQTRGRETSVSSVRESQEKSSKETATLRRLSRPAHNQTQTQRQSQSQSQRRGLLSLRGLFAAQNFSKGLRIPAGSARPTQRFPCHKASLMLQDFLPSRLEGEHYDGPRSAALATALNEEIRGLVKTVCPARYRLVCLVSLGQRGPPEGRGGDGGVMLASRCLWDRYTDTCVSHTYQNKELFCTVSVFAVYFE